MLPTAIHTVLVAAHPLVSVPSIKVAHTVAASPSAKWSPVELHVPLTCNVASTRFAATIALLLHFVYARLAFHLTETCVHLSLLLHKWQVGQLSCKESSIIFNV